MYHRSPIIERGGTLTRMTAADRDLSVIQSIQQFRYPWADLAQQVFIAHAAPRSKTEAFAHKLAATGKSLLTLDGPANANLVGLGARLVRTQRITRD